MLPRLISQHYNFDFYQFLLFHNFFNFVRIFSVTLNSIYLAWLLMFTVQLRFCFMSCFAPVRNEQRFIKKWNSAICMKQHPKLRCVHLVLSVGGKLMFKARNYKVIYINTERKLHRKELELFRSNTRQLKSNFSVTDKDFHYRKMVK